MRKVQVRLGEGSNLDGVLVVDEATGEDLTNRCQHVTILPGCRCEARLLKERDGHPYRDEETRELAFEIADVTSLALGSGVHRFTLPLERKEDAVA